MSSHNSQEPVSYHWLVTLPDQRVDRDLQIGSFRTVLDRIQRDRSVRYEPPILGWYGSPGIGKSTLVLILQEQCRQQGIPNVLISFKQEKEEGKYLHAPEQLILELADGLKLKDLSPNLYASFRQQVEAFQQEQATRELENLLLCQYNAWDNSRRQGPEPEGLDELARIRDLLIQMIAQVFISNEEPTPVVLFFDEAEQADLALTNWIEEYLIADLVLKPQVVIVWTSRRPWRWRRPEIRRRIKQEELKPFNEEEVQKQIQRRSQFPDLASQLFKNIYGITYGHPSANSIVIDEISTWSKDDITGETIAAKHSDLLATIFDWLVNDYAFSGLKPDEKTACQYLSMVRTIVDAYSLQEILQSIGGKRFAGWDLVRFADLFQDLKKTKLLEYRSGIGYTINPDLRPLIRDYYGLVHPETFRKANQAALRVYQYWLGKPVDNRALYVVEEIYHQACLDSQEEVLAELLTRRMEEFLERIRERNALILSLEHLKDEIEHDADLSQPMKSDLVSRVGGFIQQIGHTT